MKVKIPQGLRIGAYNYSLRFDENIRDDEGYTGFTNFRREEIVVLPQLAPMRRLATLFHEWVHAAEDAYHFRISEDDNWRVVESFVELLCNNFELEFDWSEIKELST
jgi:hypothetical protein